METENADTESHLPDELICIYVILKGKSLLQSKSLSLY